MRERKSFVLMHYLTPSNREPCRPVRVESLEAAQRRHVELAESLRGFLLVRLDVVHPVPVSQATVKTWFQRPARKGAKRA